jgi:MFS family permease
MLAFTESAPKPSGRLTALAWYCVQSTLLHQIRPHERRIHMLHWHIALACAAHAVALFGNAIVAVSAPSLVAQFAMSPPEFALFFALYSMPNVILPPLWAICMAPLGPAPLAAAASFLAAIGSALQYTAIHHRLASFTLLCVGRALFGVGAEMLIVATDAWATSHAESAAERQRVSELLGTASQVGRALAFAGVPYLLVAHRAAPFLLASMLCTCVMIALLGSAVSEVFSASGLYARAAFGATSIAPKRRVLNANQRVLSSAAFVFGCCSGDIGCLLLSLFCINAFSAAAFHPFEVHSRFPCLSIYAHWRPYSHFFLNPTLSLFHASSLSLSSTYTRAPAPRLRRAHAGCLALVSPRSFSSH